MYSRRISRRSSSEATIARLSPDYLLTPNFSHNEAGKNFRCQDEVWPKAMLLPKPKTTPKVQVGYKQQVTYFVELFFFFFFFFFVNHKSRGTSNHNKHAFFSKSCSVYAKFTSS